MPRSAVSVCNIALRLLGAKTITALADNTVEGRAANDTFDDTRQALLRGHPWNFAMKRVKLLSPLATKPAFKYAFQFALPSDVIVVRAIDSDTLNWAAWNVEGPNILCDMSTVGILYTVDYTNIAAMPADFCKALSGALAMEFAHQLTGLTKGIKIAEFYFKYWLNEAKTNDGMEGTTDPIEDTTLFEVRNQ